MDAVLIAGCGDIGRRVAALHLARGDCVSACARSAASAEILQGHGIEAIHFDLDHLTPGDKLPLHRALVYYFAPPPRNVNGDVNGDANTDPRMLNFIASLPAGEQCAGEQPAKVIYLSTSGVYGDCKGAWVTEDTPPNPQTIRAQARLFAEQALSCWSLLSGVPVVVLRVGGIYGPGRLPVERITQGQPVVRVEECPYTNRIHADDLARVCVAAAEPGVAGAIINVCDGQHSTMTDYFNAVADFLNLPRPPQVSLAQARQTLSPGMLSYLSESRRMDNRRMLDELKINLLYPNLAAGLAAMKPGVS